MWARQFLHWSRRTLFPASVAPWMGIANLMGLIGIRQLNRTAKLRDALETRQLSVILGRPPVPKDDEMMAGKDIKIGTNPAWIIGAMLLGAGGFWLVTRQPEKVAAQQVERPQAPAIMPRDPGIDIQVIPPNPPLQQ